VSLYPDTISVFARETTSRDANGQPVESETDRHINIPASVQLNRAVSGANGSDRHDRGTHEQPGTARVYTQTDVSDVMPDDILVHHHPKQGDIRFKVVRAVDQAGRGRRFRIEVSIL
jgi:hypothetical protein